MVTVVVLVTTTVDIAGELEVGRDAVDMLVTDWDGDGIVLDTTPDVTISSSGKVNNYSSVIYRSVTLTLYIDIIALSNKTEGLKVINLNHHAFYLESFIAHNL